MIEDSKARIAEIGARRIPYVETDDEYMDIQESHTVVPTWRVYGLYLPDDVLEKVYNLNAKKMIPGIQ